MHGCLAVHASNVTCFFNLLHMLADPAETSIDVSFTSSAPLSEADQPPPDQGVTEQHASSSDSLPKPLDKDQTPESKLWQATIKRPSSAQADDESAATPTADPRKLLVVDLQSSSFGLQTSDTLYIKTKQECSLCAVIRSLATLPCLAINWH